MADSAVSAVASDEPRGFDNFLGAVGVKERRHDFVGGCGEAGEFDRALDFYSESVQELVEYALGIALRNHQAVGIWGR